MAKNITVIYNLDLARADGIAQDSNLSEVGNLISEVIRFDLPAVLGQEFVDHLIYLDTTGEIFTEDNRKYLYLVETYLRSAIKYRVLSKLVAKDTYKVRDVGTYRVNDINMAMAQRLDLQYLTRYHNRMYCSIINDARTYISSCLDYLLPEWSITNSALY